MIRRLPRWVEYGAFLLAALAGMINAVGLLGFQHQAVSHLSGTATLLGEAIASFDPIMLHLLGIMLGFVFGAALSAYLIGSASLELGRHYGFTLMLEGTLIIVAMVLLMRSMSAGHYMASAACGLQNGLVTRYSGAIIRTTHLTGIFTDLGMMLGERLRGEAFDRRKALLFALIATGFVLGAALGSVLFARLGFVALFVPATLAFAVAALYSWYRQSDR